MDNCAKDTEWEALIHFSEGRWIYPQDQYPRYMLITAFTVLYLFAY